MLTDPLRGPSAVVDGDKILENIIESDERFIPYAETLFNNNYEKL